MLWIGIVLGLGAATAQSASYLLSRQVVVNSDQQAPIRLLVISHVAMMMVAIPLSVALWTGITTDWLTFFMLLLAQSGFYLAGQVALVWALQRADASSVSPLLGFKIVVLAVLTSAGLGDALSWPQWLAVSLATAAAVSLRRSGARLPNSAVLGVAIACVFYSGCDLAFVRFIEVFDTDSRMVAASAATALSYVVCGIGALSLLPWFGSRKGKEWRGALPFATVWLASMFMLFTCYAAIGPILGNIVQSSRGVISIGMGFLLAHAGLVHLETRLDAKTLAKRALAAVAMMVAVGLYVMGANRTGDAEADTSELAPLLEADR